MRARRRDVDDPSPPGLDHVGQHRLNRVEDPVQVDVDHSLPVLEREVAESLEPVQARGVDQNRHRPQPRADRRQRGIHLRPIRHVGGERQIGIRRSEIDRGDVQAVGAQPMRNRQTNPGSTTGDHRCLHAQAPTVNAAISVTKNLPRNYENLTLRRNGVQHARETAPQPAPRTFPGRVIVCAAGDAGRAIPMSFLNYRDANVRFAREENEIFVTVTHTRNARS